MPDKVPYEFRFPRRGLNKSRGYSSQVPDTTPDCLNVRPFDTEEGRERGGVRPGLAYHFGEAMGGNPVGPAIAPPRLLETVTAVSPATNRSWLQWSDDFSAANLSETWALFPGGSNPLPLRFSERDGIYASGQNDQREAYLVTPRSYSNDSIWLGLWFDPTGLQTGDEEMKVTLYAGMTGSPNPASYGVTARLTWYQDGSWLVYLRSTNGPNTETHSWQSPTEGPKLEPGPGWFFLRLTNYRLKAHIYLKTHTVTTDYAIVQTTSNFMGLGVHCVNANTLSAVSRFVTGYRLSSTNRRTELVGGIGNELYRINTYGEADQILYDYSPPEDPIDNYLGDWAPVFGASRGGVLYVANWNPLGSVVPLMYDPSNTSDTCDRWVTDTYASGASKGTVPQNCRLICRYRDRMVLAGAPSDPHMWYMSRMGDPKDFNYSVSVGDLRRAVAGTVADSGEIGEPITALIPHSDDYLIFGLANSIRVLRGDPVMGGQVDSLAEGIGVVVGRAWCRLPDGATILMTTDGLYYIAPGAGGFPQPLSRDQLPDDLIDIDGESIFVLMAYDPRYRGVHIILHGDNASGRRHYWFDWTARSFWPVAYGNSDHEPTLPVLAAPDMPVPTQVMFACRDGYVRAFEPTAWDDCGEPISAYLKFGPVRLADDPRLDGMVETIIGEVGEYDPAYEAAFSYQGVTPVDWSLHLGDTGHEALHASAFASGSWGKGLSKVSTSRGKGKYAVLKVASNSTTPIWPWALERIFAEVSRRGRHREP